MFKGRKQIAIAISTAALIAFKHLMPPIITCLLRDLMRIGVMHPH
ncbi:MAG: hypothetical protein OJF47_001105 [Nitrospira sp.]|nr:MAG: hypothetical protein OJF47_001105 [Nitrospira sp.]